MSDKYIAKIGSFMEPTQGFTFDTLEEAAGWFFRQMAAYLPLGVAERNGSISLVRNGVETVLAEFDFMRVRRPLSPEPEDGR